MSNIYNINNPKYDSKRGRSRIDVVRDSIPMTYDIREIVWETAYYERLNDRHAMERWQRNSVIIDTQNKGRTKKC